MIASPAIIGSVPGAGACCRIVTGEEVAEKSQGEGRICPVRSVTRTGRSGRGTNRPGVPSSWRHRDGLPGPRRCCALSLDSHFRHHAARRYAYRREAHRKIRGGVLQRRSHPSERVERPVQMARRRDELAGPVPVEIRRGRRAVCSARAKGHRLSGAARAERERSGQARKPRDVVLGGCRRTFLVTTPSHGRQTNLIADGLAACRNRATGSCGSKKPSRVFERVGSDNYSHLGIINWHDAISQVPALGRHVEKGLAGDA